MSSPTRYVSTKKIIAHLNKLESFIKQIHSFQKSTQQEINLLSASLLDNAFNEKLIEEMALFNPETNSAAPKSLLDYM